jgi:hypothetical protein
VVAIAARWTKTLGTRLEGDAPKFGPGSRESGQGEASGLLTSTTTKTGRECVEGKQNSSSFRKQDAPQPTEKPKQISKGSGGLDGGFDPSK